MRIMMIQPNYHAGGAEIAGSWPPSWVAYIGGALKTAGFDNVRFIDAMTLDIPNDQLRVIIERNRPDVILATAITPMIIKAQETLKMARELLPNTKLILGGVHPTFMYAQVLSEAPWIDYIVRGEGEEIIVELLKSIEAGSDLKDRATIQGIAYLENEKVVATPARDPIADLDTLTPDWSLLEWDKYIYVPMNVRVAVPNFARGCPFTCRFCSQWKFWRKYRSRSPLKFVDEVETLVRDYNVGFFILADEEPTLNRKKFTALCEELARRKLPVLWGINTRVTDIMRDEALLPLWRKAGLMHISLGTEAAAQMNLDRFRKQTTIEQNKRAIKMIQSHGMVAEAQFIMGMENETPETIEETYRLSQDWKPDMANWNMYTPWPFAELFEELGDKVEVRDYSKYNFVTPIMKPEAMDREDVLKGVLRNYARFYMRKAFFEYPFIKDPVKRKYMLGCLRAFMKTTVTKRFYDLGRVHMNGTQMEVDLAFDESRVFTMEQLSTLKEDRPELVADITFGGAIPRGFDPEELRHQAENTLNTPLRDENKQVGC
ncbi:magnesium-protoporphyrin IX monomethyl ester anaerobic oxidative cyclase [Candidatus Chloroploca sp. M-50]|uniref:Magnesium-protoporphyrin IX monomethyl ester anaerobic oxidative cyclase n=1 Tax=Candidatus Chloroploca mongolica TaxID=2528176 RepID=A0ABS4D6Y3_9CHLR|nr:magnesium-protoporphyrin IX monomethyl ester anaerobic oxidative cyclase [Candidatus Chloroploca mongolica]MBP1465196.1 magnesium-protoporphyrin IX monomethyl ester anaerobic oxidative cyclase [Candidatus Chloroploca mongolica]